LQFSLQAASPETFGYTLVHAGVKTGLRWVFENRVLKGIFGPKKKKWHNTGEDYTMGSFVLLV
jgi:hypothetical protein